VDRAVDAWGSGVLPLSALPIAVSGVAWSCPFLIGSPPKHTARPFFSPHRRLGFLRPMKEDFPTLAPEFVEHPTSNKLNVPRPSTHPPRFLLLYGSLRQRSYSRFLVQEADRLLRRFGAETRIYDPRGLPQPDDASPSHPKVAELRAASLWSEGHVWCSPERHGTITGIFKSQIDWLPLESEGVRPTQGRTLAVMQVNAGSQSFNAVNTLRVLGRWMRMITIPNQSSVPKAYEEFDEAGRMKPSTYYDRLVDVMEELYKFTLLTRDIAPYLVDRYSERKSEGRSPPSQAHLASVVETAD
jgi:arsenic resistance protein ArsH